MPNSVPWSAHLIRGTVVLVIVLLFQQLVRGETTPSIAIVVTLGYILVAELARRYRDRQG